MLEIFGVLVAEELIDTMDGDKDVLLVTVCVAVTEDDCDTVRT